MSLETVRYLLGSLGGRKFLVFVMTLLVVIFKNYLGLDQETIKWIIGLASSFIVGQGVADGFSKGNTSTVSHVREMERERVTTPSAQSN